MPSLEEVAQISGGGTPSRSETQYFGGGICWATPTDVTALDDLYIERTKETLSEEGLNKSSAKLLPAGAVLLTSRATIGYTAVSRVPICTNQGFVNFVCGPALEPAYLAYWLRARKPLLERMANGATFKEISRGTVRKLVINLPDRAEQLRIVDLLSRAENIVRMRREAEAMAKEIIPALFLDMFGDPARNERGWDVRSVGAVIRLAEYGTSTKSSADGAGIPVIRMGNVDAGGRLSLDDLKYVVLPEQEQRKYALAAGDILFNRTNSKELVGKTGIWRGPENAVAASYFIRVRVDEAVVAPDYFWAFMNSQHMKRVLFGTARGAIGQSNINAQELRALSIPVPPVARQRAFADRAVQALGLEGQQAVATAQANLGFQSMLAGVFEE